MWDWTRQQSVHSLSGTQRALPLCRESATSVQPDGWRSPHPDPTAPMVAPGATVQLDRKTTTGRVGWLMIATPNDWLLPNRSPNTRWTDSQRGYRVRMSRPLSVIARVQTDRETCRLHYHNPLMKYTFRGYRCPTSDRIFLDCLYN